MPEPGREETVRVVALDKNFHMKCYKCEVGCTPRPEPLGDGRLVGRCSRVRRWTVLACRTRVLQFEGGQWWRPHPPREDASLASGWPRGVL